MLQGIRTDVHTAQRQRGAKGRQGPPEPLENAVHALPIVRGLEQLDQLTPVMEAFYLRDHRSDTLEALVEVFGRLLDGIVVTMTLGAVDEVLDDAKVGNETREDFFELCIRADGIKELTNRLEDENTSPDRHRRRRGKPDFLDHRTSP